MGFTKDGSPDVQCLPPGDTRVYVLLRDATTGQNLLVPPSRYPQDSLRVVYANGTVAPAATDTMAGERVLVFAHATPSSCGGTDQKFGFWGRVFLRFKAADTDTLAFDRLPSGWFEYRYNGELKAVDSQKAFTRIRLDVRK